MELLYTSAVVAEILMQHFTWHLAQKHNIALSHNTDATMILKLALVGVVAWLAYLFIATQEIDPQTLKGRMIFAQLTLNITYWQLSI